MSTIVPLPRIFRPRLEIRHRPSAAAAPEWLYQLEYVGARGRKPIGICVDVETAFNVAMVFRRMGIRPACIEGSPP